MSPTMTALLALSIAYGILGAFFAGTHKEIDPHTWTGERVDSDNTNRREVV